MNISFKSLFVIWSLSPLRFRHYFFLSIVSWQYQKYSTILILVLCLLCNAYAKRMTQYCDPTISKYMGRLGLTR